MCTIHETTKNHGPIFFCKIPEGFFFVKKAIASSAPLLAHEQTNKLIKSTSGLSDVLNKEKKNSKFLKKLENIIPEIHFYKTLRIPVIGQLHCNNSAVGTTKVKKIKKRESKANSHEGQRNIELLCDSYIIISNPISRTIPTSLYGHATLSRD